MAKDMSPASRPTERNYPPSEPLSGGLRYRPPSFLKGRDRPPGRKMKGHETNRFGNATLCMRQNRSAELPIVCVTALALHALSVAFWLASCEGSSEALPVHDR